jgi:Fic family protein
VSNSESFQRGDDQEPLGQRQKLIWAPGPGVVGGRKRRRGGPYEAFIPARIAERRFVLGDRAVTAIASATKALASLAVSQPRLASLSALASNLLRSESAASSRIEGLAMSHKRLARAAYRETERPDADGKAAEVLGNVKAMRQAIELGASKDSISISDIQEIHRTLLRFGADRGIAGVIREEQNWIGGNDYNPIGAAFVPPPPGQVHPLLDDFCRFVARDDLAPIAQAAIAHAQFENIHPFADGNGRIGRALIYTVLRRRGETGAYVPPVSLVLAAEPKSYVAGFGAYSGGDVGAWCELFADATERAAQEAERMAFEIERRQESWLGRLGNPRRDAAVRQLVSALPEQPVIDVAVGRRLSGKSHVAVQNALNQLERAGILQRLNERKWGRVWECGELLQLVEDFEEAVALPDW